MFKKKKNEKIPYKEYRAIKEQKARKKFTLHPYPLPVLAALLAPLAIFIVMLCFYYLSVRHFSG